MSTLDTIRVLTDKETGLARGLYPTDPGDKMIPITVAELRRADLALRKVQFVLETLTT